MDSERKQKLNDRIVTTLLKHKRKQRIRKISYVTSIALLLTVGISTWLQTEGVEPESTIVDHATSQEVDYSPDSEVRLILGNKKEVNIAQQQPKIKYSQNGNTISISNHDDLEQVASSGKLVYNTIIVPYGKRSEISLSDGTKVWLNSGTKFTYPVAFNGKNREVHLEGEAIFDVVHQHNDATFHVITENYNVKVLGTVFNVSSYSNDEYSSTALAEGSIELSYNQKGSTAKSVKIVPGTLATFHKTKKNMETTKTDIAPYMSWRDGRFTFRNNDLKYILNKISRHYGVQLNTDDAILKNRTFSGTLNIENNLETILGILTQTTGLEFQISQNKITINQSKKP